MQYKLRFILIITAIIGLLNAIYLTIIKLTDNRALCLPGLGDCYSVNNSVYSEVLGIPVAILGAGAFFMILALLWIENRSPAWKQIALYALFGFSLAGLIYSVYLTYIEFFVLQAVCPFCLISAIMMLVLAVLSTVRLMWVSGESNS